MKTSNQQIYDLLLMHHLDLIRFSKHLTGASKVLLNDTNEAVQTLVTKYALKIIKAGPQSLTSRKLYKELLAEIIAIRNPAWSVVIPYLMGEMKGLVNEEVEVAEAIIEGSLPLEIAFVLPPLNVLNSIVSGIPYQGRTCKEWLTKAANDDSIRITRAVKAGLVDGTPLHAILTDLKKKVHTASRDLESIVLTVSSGIANSARSEFYQANSDIIEEELFVATLDLGTTPLCAITDQKVFPLGKGLIPPLHFRCRSIRVPYINADNLRNRGFDSSTTKTLLKEFCELNNLSIVSSYKSLPRGYKGKYNAWAQTRKREMVGQVPAITSFTDWFDLQSVQFQNEYLGVRRAMMYRKGTPLSKLIADDGILLTLAQLKQRGMDVPDLAA